MKRVRNSWLEQSITKTNGNVVNKCLGLSKSISKIKSIDITSFRGIPAKILRI